MAAPDPVPGVTLTRSPQPWQVVQQDADGTASIPLAGAWHDPEDRSRPRVVARLVREDTYEPVGVDLDWQGMTTHRDGTWSGRLRAVPAGGPYRLETALTAAGGAVEWGARGDMVHHLGVGDVWLIAGQSNAEGHGRSPIHDPPVPGVAVFRTAGRWDLASHPLGDTTASRYPASRLGVNVSHSPWLAFGRRLHQDLGYPIGLVPASLGGSPLALWNREEDGTLFENLLRMLADAGGGARGLVWYQGESDTGPGARESYGRRFGRFLRDLRRSLKRPRLPVITAQINRTIGLDRDAPGHAGWEAVREAQRRAAGDAPEVFVLSTLDCGLSDGIHNHAAANVVIGERAARTALGGVYGRPVVFRHPECVRARATSAKRLELRFEHVAGRLHYENNRRTEFPFAVRDEAGEVPIESWTFRGKRNERLVLALGRRPGEGATVTGAPSACPPPVVPFDIANYSPMLGFTLPVT
jgi:hypothetical protein